MNIVTSSCRHEMTINARLLFIWYYWCVDIELNYDFIAPSHKICNYKRSLSLYKLCTIMPANWQISQSVLFFLKNSIIEAMKQNSIPKEFSISVSLNSVGHLYCLIIWASISDIISCTVWHEAEATELACETLFLVQKMQDCNNCLYFQCLQ